jgi:hypothetical protein
VNEKATVGAGSVLQRIMSLLKATPEVTARVGDLDESISAKAPDVSRGVVIVGKRLGDELSGLRKRQREKRLSFALPIRFSAKHTHHAARAVSAPVRDVLREFVGRCKERLKQPGRLFVFYLKAFFELVQVGACMARQQLVREPPRVRIGGNAVEPLQIIHECLALGTACEVFA